MLDEYLFLSVRKDTKKSMHIQIIDVISLNYIVVFKINIVVFKNHADDLIINENENAISQRDERVYDWIGRLLIQNDERISKNYVMRIDCL